jgi:uncharacterized protein related to proFAR isomerase
MKTLLNILLAASAILLVVMCYQSLMIPIDFNKEVARRDAVVIQRLKDVRTLQEEYQKKYHVYAASWDQLVNFAKNDKIAIVQKIGTLTDEQLQAGLNEQKAWTYLQDPKKYAKQIAEFGLSKATFSRDSIFVSVLEKDSALSRPDFNIDELRFIPIFFEEQAKDTILLATGTQVSASGFEMPLFEAKIPYSNYLGDLNEQELSNKIVDREELGKYPGMMVGDATVANNNAGNWE